jgi:23S rRNA (cytidine1920-2'-O)/16S rRNA (cytidine1409-2'-O)-methyltransferase
MRLDVELVDRGLARSRTQAAALIEAERVVVNGRPAKKASAPVTEDANIVVLEAVDYVSRAGHKLAGALEAFPEIPVEAKVCLDIGASTGGFTEVLLRRGAQLVIGVDVGHDQMVPELALNSRVINLEGFNARELSPETLVARIAESGRSFDLSNNPIELVVSDLSFISLTLVLEAIVKTAPMAHLVLLIKPQFEVGKQSLSAHGIVNDHRLRAAAIRQVTEFAQGLGLGITGLAKSSLPGTHGNIEYLLWIAPNQARNQSEWSDRIDALAKER